MTPRQIELVQRSFRSLLPITDGAAALFYTRLFELDPELRSLFHSDMKQQGQKLMVALGVIVRHLHNLGEILPGVRALAERHASYGVKSSHYATVGQALLDTLRAGLGDTFTGEVRDAWLGAYSVLSETMIAAVEEPQPAWRTL